MLGREGHDRGRNFLEGVGGYLVVILLKVLSSQLLVLDRPAMQWLVPRAKRIGCLTQRLARQLTKSAFLEILRDHKIEVESPYGELDKIGDTNMLFSTHMHDTDRQCS